MFERNWRNIEGKNFCFYHHISQFSIILKNFKIWEKNAIKIRNEGNEHNVKPTVDLNVILEYVFLISFGWIFQSKLYHFKINQSPSFCWWSTYFLLFKSKMHLVNVLERTHSRWEATAVWTLQAWSLEPNEVDLIPALQMRQRYNLGKLLKFVSQFPCL